MITAAWIALFAPAVAVVLIGFLRDSITRAQAGGVAALGTLVSFIASLVAFVSLLGDAPDDRGRLSTLYTWLSAGDLQIGMDIFIDPLSVFMMMIVSGVGFLILAYAVGYMHGDSEERRYHAYKALFVFSMLLLVMAGNLVLLLAGWGMVGLSSYLLINYWHQRHSAVAAGKKAFVVNAFGDATFAISIFLLIQHVGVVDFPGAFAGAEAGLGQSTTVAVIVALGLLGAAAAKSAQVPLHTWLPDAMEGPTPVSALIHAATMVTAGVYLIARTHVLFELAPAVLHTAAVLGGITLLVAGLIALVQTDIKRVIAYSTMSQIGYMFLAAGLGAYAAGMFHLMTHAFFKALLFMAAGVLIHALADEQDIRKMRGLGSRMPLTHKAFLIGALALAGFPPLSGFFSKDLILAHSLAEGVLGPILWVVALVGAFLTAVYTFRLLFIVFGGEATDHVREHFHKERFEGPLTMMLPVGVLAVLAVVGVSDPDSRRMACGRRLDRAGRRVAPASRHLDGDRLADRSRGASAARHGARLAAVGHGQRRARPPASTPSAHRTRARAQALLRRAVRVDALGADAAARRRTEALRRGAAHPRLRRRARARPSAASAGSSAVCRRVSSEATRS